MKPTKADPCVFTDHEEESTLILAIYIDDGLIAATDAAIVTTLLTELKREFEVTTGTLNLFLGLQIERCRDGSIFLHQTSYTRKILERFNMTDANLVAVSIDKHQTLCVSMHGKERATRVQTPYREAVGSLMYLAIGTRPDIAFALSTVSQYLELPDKIHWNAVKRILKYLKETADYGLVFKANTNLNILAFSDADYAGDVDTRRPTTGYIFKLSENTISWCSQKQKVVALSTTGSEFIAAAQTIKELIWLDRLTNAVIGEKNSKPLLYLDNQSAIKLLKNPELHKRTKHIDVRYHFAREKCREGVFNLQYIPTKEQLGDILMKPLARAQFCYLRNLLGIQRNTLK